jgi:hypothetical protein
MNFPEWAKISKVAPEVAYAGEYNERTGGIFGHTFGASDAVDKAAKTFCEYLEDGEDWEKLISKVRYGFQDWT